MSNLILEIRNLIEKYIYNMYQNYLIDNNILLIKRKDIKNIITKMYTENSKNIKMYVRDHLKNTMKDE